MPNWKKLIVSGSSANLSNLNVDNAVTASYFTGDGSGLTGVTATVVETATVSASFNDVSSVLVTHNFGTKDVIVSTYLSNDTLFYPASVTTVNTSSVNIAFGSNRTGRVVVAKGGHVVQGSIVGNVSFSNLTNTPTLLSSSNQIASEISGSFTSLSGSIATRFDGLTSDYTELTNIPSGIISSSVQLASDISGSFTVTSSSLASRISNIVDGTTLVSSASYAISSSHEITFELSSSHAEVADEVPYIGITGKPSLVSGSNQLASDISGSTTALSASIATRFDGLTSDYTELTNVPSGIISSSTQFNALSDTTSSYALTASYALNAGGGSGAGFPFSGSAVITGSLYVSGSSISGSFAGDGSGLTGLTISEFATVEDTFTNAPSHSVVHNFGTKNVFVQVFEDDDTLLIPFSVTTTTVNQVDIVFGDTLSGRVVIGKAGHILQDTGNFVSSSTAVQTFTNATTASINHYLDSFNVITQVFDSNNNVIVPSNIKVATKDRVDLTFASSRSGKVVIAKAGHIVSGTAAVSASYATTSSFSETSERVLAGTSGSRDLVTPQSGSLWFNTNTSNLEVYSGASGSGWEIVGDQTAPSSVLTVDYLVVAGAGGGGGSGGGGGAGGLRTSYGSTSGGGASAESTLTLSTSTNYTVTVGSGGAGGAGSAGTGAATDGNDSVFSDITSDGGGGGGNWDSAGADGGSGGGAGRDSETTDLGGTATPSQGYDGGDGSSLEGGQYGGAGGGGASAAGGAQGAATGTGGAGLAVNIINTTDATTASVGEVFGSDVYFAGGGGAGGYNTGTHADGGIGGGGDGVDYSGGAQNGNNGTANTGGGAGGGSGPGLAGGSGGSGGSGVVILRYPSSYTITVGSGITEASGSPFTQGTDKISVFTAGTGNISFS